VTSRQLRLRFRWVLQTLHRWAGLATAAFLFVAGFTGALIAWDHELEEVFAPSMVHAEWDGPPLTALELADRLEAAEPHVYVSYLPLNLEPDHTLSIFAQARTDPETGAPFEVAADQFAMDPVRGEVQAARRWGALTLRPIGLMPMLYKLHYSLHLPFVGGVDSGALFMGIVAMVWTLDCFVALLLAFPSRRSWRKSFAFRWRAGGPAFLFDLHRSGGVWLWLAVLVIAFTAISMNLGPWVVRPAVAAVSEVEPDMWDEREMRFPPPPASVDRRQALSTAIEVAEERSWEGPPGAIFFSEPHGMYSIGFFEAGMDHGDGSLGNNWVYVDAGTGEVLGQLEPGTGSLGDLFLQAQFPLHSGRILGTVGRALVSLLGVAIAVLSATGVWLWARKRIRRARRPQAVAS